MRIERPDYMRWLERWRGKDVIKVVTGLRRCGKSTVLKLYRDRLATEGVPADHIISINFESMAEKYPTQARPLYDYIVSRLAQGGTNYVFLDEIQHVRDFEKCVDGLYVRDDVDLYITGSNADLLSSELATLLTGRYVELRMLPLSFREYRTTRPENESAERSFERYLLYGGLPYAATLNDDQAIADYLGGVFNTILVKDIARRHAKINMAAFNDVASFLADNAGNITSIKGIADAMRQIRPSISPTTIGEYIAALRENYLLFRADRYDIKGKAYLKTLEKYYLGDPGFRFWFLGKTSGDLGHRIENVIYLELLRRYKTVHIGKVGSTEVDFYTPDPEGDHYYQVSLTVMDESTLARELRPLQTINDNHPKTLLTMDRIGNGNHAGIRQINIIDWLLQNRQ
ncbi:MULTISPECIES: ATP-binding protein [Bifidobacterium]|uniref:ATP-binding protein n=1 Tax=Bifidobacterium TaxID=1678 RepID=UPI001BDCF244|nr:MULTISPECIES: ATP-binding protein [Bifidobacterium]MBT1162010.1 ATP-binding protein [Bifidobacterium sp. SO1]MBW3079081.1 ATP-binding protein [Bifidobacterium simiiventris]